MAARPVGNRKRRATTPRNTCRNVEVTGMKAVVLLLGTVANTTLEAACAQAGCVKVSEAVAKRAVSGVTAVCQSKEVTQPLQHRQDLLEFLPQSPLVRIAQFRDLHLRRSEPDLPGLPVRPTLLE